MLGWSAGKDVETESGRIRSALRFDMDKYKALAEACGFTRKALGFTGHGFRHSFAHEEFKVHGYIPAIKVGRQSLAGMIRAIGNETAVGSEQKDAVVHAQTKVSEALGHSRPSVTRAYYGKTKLVREGNTKPKTDA